MECEKCLLIGRNEAREPRKETQKKRKGTNITTHKDGGRKLVEIIREKMSEAPARGGGVEGAIEKVNGSLAE